MGKRHRTLLLLGTAATVLTLFATPRAADANSRRHVFKPDEVTGTRGPTVDRAGAPEIDGASLGLAVALAAGGLATLVGRRRRSDG